MMKTINFDDLIAHNGAEIIGAAQRVIAYSAIADAGGGYVEVTAAGHGLKKWQTIFVATGFYAGLYPVYKVVSSSKFWIKAEWGATASGNINLTAALNGGGFFVTTAPTIAEFEAEDPNFDNAAFIARVFAVGETVLIPFKRIRITAGNLTVARQAIKAELDYDRYNNVNADKAPPLLSTVTVEDAGPSSVVLTFTDSHNLDPLRIPAASSFAISGVASTPTITAVALNGSAKTVTLTLSAPVVQADAPLLTYTPGANAIRDVNGNLAAAFEDFAVDNNVVD
jgi:uncharacterized repeat protein (TIGR02059 family)